MEEAKQQLVQNWLIKAQHDLATARKLSDGPDPYLDTAIYHCQQAAEKAVKGFLVFRDQRFEKVHHECKSIPKAYSFRDAFCETDCQLALRLGKFSFNHIAFFAARAASAAVRARLRSTRSARSAR
ncbi:MAG: HEPN domain-containing protein, partial [Chloroflexota bacterium]